MKCNFKIVGTLVAICFVLLACSRGNPQREISIGYSNWAEGIAMTNLVQRILEDQGYEVTILNADIAPIFASVARGKVDLFLDAWKPVTHADYMAKYGKNLDIVSVLYNNARIGLIVPEYVTINSVEELNANRDKFDGKIVGIDAGAGVMQASDKALVAYDLDYELLTSSGPAMTASLKRAIDNKKWIVATAWSPHWMFSRFKLKFLDDPKHIYGQQEQALAISWKGFSKAHPYVSDFLKRLEFTDLQIASLMDSVENHDSMEEAMRSWMKDHQDVINAWLPERPSKFKK